jgi:hypothetical protein
MKTDSLFFAALLLTWTTLWARIGIQGFEQALLSTAIEWSLNAIRAGTRFLPNTLSSVWSLDSINLRGEKSAAEFCNGLKNTL